MVGTTRNGDLYIYSEYFFLRSLSKNPNYEHEHGSFTFEVELNDDAYFILDIAVFFYFEIKLFNLYCKISNYNANNKAHQGVKKLLI